MTNLKIHWSLGTLNQSILSGEKAERGRPKIRAGGRREKERKKVGGRNFFGRNRAFAIKTGDSSK